MDERADGGRVLGKEAGGCFFFSNDTDWERTAPLCGDQGETGVGERGGLGGEEGRTR